MSPGQEGLPLCECERNAPMQSAEGSHIKRYLTGSHIKRSHIMEIFHLGFGPEALSTAGATATANAAAAATSTCRPRHLLPSVPSAAATSTTGTKPCRSRHLFPLPVWGRLAHRRVVRPKQMPPLQSSPRPARCRRSGASTIENSSYIVVVYGRS